MRLSRTWDFRRLIPSIRGRSRRLERHSCRRFRRSCRHCCRRCASGLRRHRRRNLRRKISDPVSSESDAPSRPEIKFTTVEFRETAADDNRQTFQCYTYVPKNSHIYERLFVTS